MQNKFVIVTGTPASGKTTIVETFKKSKTYKIINYGDIICSICIAKGYIKNRDEIRYLENSTFTKVKALAWTKISEMKGNIIIDTHATVEQHGRYVQGLPVSELAKLKKIVGFVYIDTQTEEIIRRRKMDKKRTREIEAVSEIDMQRLINLAVLAHHALHSNVPVYIINNDKGMLNKSKKQFISDLKDAFS